MNFRRLWRNGACLALGCAAQLSCASASLSGLRARDFEVLSTSTVLEPVAACDLTEPRDELRSWVLVDEAGLRISEQVLELHAQKTNSFGATRMIPTAAGDRQFVSEHSPGDCTLLAAEAPSDHAVSLFETGLALTSQDLDPGETFVSSSPMRVDWLDGRGERDGGVGERTMRIAGEERIRTPMGEFSTMRVETKFEAKLRMARATRNTTRWIARGVGPIAERWEERVTVLGLPISREVGFAVRVPTIASTIHGTSDTSATRVDATR